VSSDHYKEYVADREFIEDYSVYQQRYADQIRESDRVVIDIVRELTAGRDGAEVLDIGCSTGNLLRHLRNLVESVSLTGADLTPEVLDQCRADPGLEGVAFEEMDLLDLPKGRFDVVISNAVLYLMSDDEYARAAASVAAALKPGGSFVAFDFCHPFEQELEIRETSRTHPRGLMLHFRPQASVERIFLDAGFAGVDFRPFEIPIDLERNPDDGELISYTRTAADGARLLFRGALFQPWCHVVASKAD
jgi:SAM-dependent methyltransferase